MHCAKKGICVFPFLSKKVIRNATVKFLPYCNLKVIFKSPSKIANHFHIKNVFIKNSALVLFMVLSVIAAALFIMVKQNAIFTSEQVNIWGFSI